MPASRVTLIKLLFGQNKTFVFVDNLKTLVSHSAISHAQSPNI